MPPTSLAPFGATPAWTRLSAPCSASAGGARAVEAAGEQAVREVLPPVLTQFRDPANGTVTLRNTFRCGSSAER